MPPSQYRVWNASTFATRVVTTVSILCTAPLSRGIYSLFIGKIQRRNPKYPPELEYAHRRRQRGDLFF